MILAMLSFILSPIIRCIMVVSDSFDRSTSSLAWFLIFAVHFPSDPWKWEWWSTPITSTSTWSCNSLLWWWLWLDIWLFAMETSSTTKSSYSWFKEFIFKEACLWSYYLKFSSNDFLNYYSIMNLFTTVLLFSSSPFFTGVTILALTISFRFLEINL